LILLARESTDRERQVDHQLADLRAGDKHRRADRPGDTRERLHRFLFLISPLMSRQ